MAIWKEITHYVTNIRSPNYGNTREVWRRLLFRKRPVIEFEDMTLPEVDHAILVMFNQLATLKARFDAACDARASVITSIVTPTLPAALASPSSEKKEIHVVH